MTRDQERNIITSLVEGLSPEGKDFARALLGKKKKIKPENERYNRTKRKLIKRFF